MNQQPPWQPPPYGQQPYGQPQWRQQPPPRPRSRRRFWLILSIIGGVLLFSCIACSVAVAFTSVPKGATQATTPTATLASQLPQATGTSVPTTIPTLTPTQAPTPTPTHTPTPKPTAKPTPTHPPPTPTPCPGTNCNPWGYNFTPGKLIYYPPSNFCAYFNCIASFWGSDDPGDGYVVQCVDGSYSQSGGESGACSYHGGVSRPLYSH